MGLINRVNSRYKTVLMFLLSSVGITVLLVVTFYTSIEKIIYDDYYNSLKLKTNILAQIHIDELHSGKTSAQNIKDLYTVEDLVTPGKREYVFDIGAEEGRLVADSLGIPHSFIRKIISSGESSYQD